MINLICKSIITLAVISTCFGEIYYVSTTGSDTQDGKSIGNAWQTIKYVASKAVAGDTVYIKAGNYGNDGPVFGTNGTADQRIHIEGYRTTPGDITAADFKYGDNLDATKLPLINGGNRSSGGTGITLNSRQYITMKNFQVTQFEVGLYAWGAKYCTIENVVSVENGDQHASYNGKGIVVGSKSHKCTVRNCFVLNACAEGLSVMGDSNLVENNKVYCDDNSTGHEGAMDYYLHSYGNYNVIRGNHVERKGNLAHGGHGIGLKTDAQYNLIENNTVVNCSGGFNVRHRGIRFNTFINNTSLGVPGGTWNSGIVVRDGASYNTFINHRVSGCMDAIGFYDTSEDNGAQYAGRHNLFVNCLFENTVENVINFSYYDQVTPADSNTFVNCVFSGGEYLFLTQRESYDNLFVNCIITGVKNYRTNGTRPNYPLSVGVNYSCFWNNGFTMPTGQGNISVDPKFADENNGDYHLKSAYGRWDTGTGNWVTDTETSPLIDAGHPDSSFINEPEPNGGRVNIGLYGNTEYASKSQWSVIGIIPCNQLERRTQGSISVMDITGRLIPYVGNTQAPTGCYIIQVTDTQGQWIGKIVILELKKP